MDKYYNGNSCIVKNCITNNTKSVSLFRFPKDPERCKIWVAACNCKEIYNERKGYLYNSYYRVCGLHFEDKMFLNDLKNRLQPNASPTLFLNNSVVLQYKSAENIMTSSPSLLVKKKPKFQHLSIETVCRTCLVKKMNMKNINQHVADILKDLTDIEVSIENSILCTDCIYEIHRWYTFKQKVKNSLNLTNWIKENKNENVLVTFSGLSNGNTDDDSNINNNTTNEENIHTNNEKNNITKVTVFKPQKNIIRIPIHLISNEIKLLINDKVSGKHEIKAKKDLINLNSIKTEKEKIKSNGHSFNINKIQIGEPFTVPEIPNTNENFKEIKYPNTEINVNETNKTVDDFNTIRNKNDEKSTYFVQSTDTKNLNVKNVTEKCIIENEKTKISNLITKMEFQESNIVKNKNEKSGIIKLLNAKNTKKLKIKKNQSTTKNPQILKINENLNSAKSFFEESLQDFQGQEVEVYTTNYPEESVEISLKESVEDFQELEVNTSCSSDEGKEEIYDCEFTLNDFEKIKDPSKLIFQCKVCQKKLKTYWSLYQHKRIHEKRIFLCIKCKTNFSFAWELVNHLKQCKNKPNKKEQKEKVIFYYLKCELCDKKFTDSYDLFKHCHKSFRLKHVIERHSNLHTKNIQFFCDICKKGFSNSSGLSYHMQSLHSFDKNFLCEKCPMAFNTMKKLKWHINNKHEEKVEMQLENQTFNCGICSQTFQSFNSLINHQIVHNEHEKEKCICTLCGKYLYSKLDLSIHMKIHEIERSHLCRICNKSFPTVANLEEHLITHHREKLEYICKECFKCFKTKATLSIHLKRHLKVKIYICKLCGKTYKNLKHLKTHMKLHKNVHKLKKHLIEKDRAEIVEGDRKYCNEHNEIIKGTENNENSNCR